MKNVGISQSNFYNNKLFWYISVFKPRFAEPKITRHERDYDPNGGGGDYYDFMDRGKWWGKND